jgi:4-amino-4-deoxy-L-arabinose transferase-like glycosyltransferase
MSSIALPSLRLRLVLAALVALLTFVAVFATLDDVGLTWDEPAYMGSAQAYGDWFTVVGRSLARLDPAQAFSQSVLDQYWQQSQADLHPPLGKMLPAITWRLLRGALGDINALRTGNAVLFAGLVGIVFLLATQIAGLPGGLFAAAGLALMPRLFFHGHLTALDIPVAFAWALTVFIFWQWASSPRPRLWPIVLLLGLSYGLALGSKNTSFILPVVLFLWILLFRRTRQALTLLIGMGFGSIIVFLAAWPWLYGDLAGNLSLYLQKMTVGHWDIVQYYLGEAYTRPPWHYPFVIVAATVPATILAMSLLGLLRVASAGRGAGGGWLIALNALLPLVFFGFVSSQVYGAERLFLVVFPFLAILAGIGFAGLWARIPRAIWRAPVACALGVALLLPGAVGIVRMHPYELSYFSEIVGGIKGAERMGLELTYWCETYRAALPFLNSIPEQVASVWTEEDGVLYTYQQRAMLRRDVQVGGRVMMAGPAAADYALVQRRPSGYTPDIERIMQAKAPVFVVRHGDTELAWVYKVK